MRQGNWGYIFQPEKATPGYKLPVGASPADPSGKLATNDDRCGTVGHISYVPSAILHLPFLICLHAWKLND